MAKRKSKYKNKLCSDGCGRKRDAGRSTCLRCKTRRWRQSNPILDAMNHLKDSARRRHLDYDLDLEWFTEFVKDNGYIEGKGLTGQSLTIDRIDNLKGYVKGNLQVLTRSENSSKFWDLDVERLASLGIHVAVGGGAEMPF